MNSHLTVGGEGNFVVDPFLSVSSFTGFVDLEPILMPKFTEVEVNWKRCF